MKTAKNTTALTLLKEYQLKLSELRRIKSSTKRVDVAQSLGIDDQIALVEQFIKNLEKIS